MQQYTRRNLQLADSYIADLKEGPALKVCKIPLALAHATVNQLHEKWSANWQQFWHSIFVVKSNLLPKFTLELTVIWQRNLLCNKFIAS